MNLAKLLHSWFPELISDCDISGLHNDSRQVKPGYLFLAYPGAAADGRLFMRQAVAAGAVAIIYEPELLPEACLPMPDVPCLPMPGLGKRLAALANSFYEYPSRDLAVTGVTGTNGKTTIAYQLAQAYELLEQRAAYIGTLGEGTIQTLNPLANTTPDGLCLQQLLHRYRSEGLHQVCMEVSSHALSQKRVDQIDFVHAIYTNLSHEHLDYHHTMEAYAVAKSELFALATLKSAVINLDDVYASYMAKRLNATCQKITYGLYSDCDVRAIHIQTSRIGSEFEVVSPWGTYPLQINTLGQFNIYNSLAVFTTLLMNGYDPTKLVPIMAKLQAAPGRMEVICQEPCIIVDYAHTPDALDNVLSTLNQLKAGRLMVVFGCGGDRDKAKRPIMGRIASQHADLSIVTSDNPRTEDPLQIIADISQGLLSSRAVLKIVDRKQAIEKAISLADKEDIILIAGKGHEAYQQIGHERFDFSDQNIVRDLMEH
ncbi:UDP-N-acetylmuramoyl-L-alanyl-D-glutamate--2,6-diaminopimelate ligase [Legionella nagasakiensis]|uniref:UDP-N-acetylmuramoyl-L-alanyl-D-glutamate--2, 6-diaminopimelate ligase n=1 Tax=Legionella nagasakiensis TaxID=535290 RepID=UPI001055D239|nr:UDP-N-acetylmuramoyl-L-alanyl-D-glutamate--2,6-diaminopimelate ligase [Legionella nagasakiensis]